MSWDHVYDSDDDCGYDDDFGYPKDERIFHVINQYISLKDEDMKRNNSILNQVLAEVIRALKSEDAFFRDYFQNIVFAGSYYKGTKVGKPDEFDLNVVIRLPVKYNSIKFEETMPGYTQLKLCDDSFLPAWNDHKKLLSKWLSNGWFETPGYLRQDKFRQWMEGLFSKLPSSIAAGYQLRISKSGPAFTLTVTGDNFSGPISVDLVPVLEFRNEMSLRRTGLNNSRCWYAVPKPLEPNQKVPEVQWRISFYMMERDILKLYNNAFVKPVIRQIKKLRDKYNFSFASYYIETIFLSEIRMRPQTLRRMGATQIFLHMLKQVQDACTERKIGNYWDTKHNLIAHMSSAHLENIAGLLRRIIAAIKRDPLTVANYILTDEELQRVQHLIDRIRNGEELASLSTAELELKEPASSCTIL